MSKIFRRVESRCISYAIDTNIFYREKDPGFKKKHNIPEENLIFLFAAQSAQVDRKGFDLLLEAFNKIKKARFTLIVLGHFDNSKIEGIDARIVGTVADSSCLRSYYSSADAFIIPSREDNLPNVMLESFACGTPVIGFPVGGIKEHVIDFKTGLLADDVSSESLANAIEKFCMNQEYFNSENIRKYAEEKFNEKSIAGEYIKLYKQLLKK